MRALILIGVSGVDKSTYTANLFKNSKNKIHVYNADTYRLQMFNQLHNTAYYEDGKKVNPDKQVFSKLNENLNNDLNKYTDDDNIFVIDNMNLSRKRRRYFYDKFNSFNIPVEVHVFFASEKTINSNQNKRAMNNPDAFVKEPRIHQMFKTLQVPRKNVDCDSIICHGEKMV